MKKKLLALSLTTVCAMGIFAGCSTPEETAPAPAETATEEAATTEETETEETTETAELAYETLVMGLDDTFAPMGFRDENNELVGFDIDLANAVSEELGIEIEFQPIEWSMKETELNGGNIDLIWNGYSITEERKELVTFTEPYLNNRQVIVVASDSGIATMADLSGKTIATQAESSSEAAINAMPEVKDTFGDYVTFATYEECLRDLEAGRTDAVVGDQVLMSYYIANHPELSLTTLEEDFGDEEYGIGVRKEDEALAAAVNEAMDALKENGKGAEISTKWFGSDILQ